ncbi:PKD domain-containing protein [Larkinella punicea]|uniref:PKD domain-containing protein n=1 Tax=Larkinella punicea TaxID=2315727 RepID=A0A368JP89_9BACT|nr:PKD domain-containing protein [Larkinella punicea]RCR69480.1 hypothetical protein DUE52_11560 [Larkinella punicea]
MANPYFDEVYPATGTQHFDFSKYGLTIFRPDSILTAEQLNLLFGFLLNQEQLTRTRLLGVGVVCGLKPSLNPDNTITVSAGYGVTTDGDLLSLETTIYTKAVDYVLIDHPDYKPFDDNSDLNLWEIFPANYTDDTQTILPLTDLDLSDKVVVLYLESEAKVDDKCTGVACDAKGKVFLNQLRVMLVRKSDANALISTGLRQAAAACTRLPVLTMTRVRLDDRPYTPSLQRFQVFLRRTAVRLADGLRDAYELIRAVDPANLTPMTAPANTLLELTRKVSANYNSQYVYDWLKDLHDAYTAFREATCHWLVACMPLNNSFPKHLLAGELVTEPGLCQPQFRHEWIRSQAVAPAADSRRKAFWLYQRILKMIELFDVPETRFDRFSITGRGTVTTLISLKITPDPYRKSPIDQRAMPFYYQPAMRAFWSYEQHKHCRTGFIHSYHRPQPALPEIQNPFAYALETYPFYRIEGFVGAGVLTTLNEILSQRRIHNLAFEVLALRLDADQLLITQDQPFDFADLTADFEDLQAQILCHVPEVDGRIPPFDLALPMTPAIFRVRWSNYQLIVSRFAGQRAAMCILAKLPLLQKLKDAYEKRKAAFEANLTFGPFLLQHPGLEHGAGVPPGGTFVMVYKDPVMARKDRRLRKGGESIVVADFYLPYRCCGSGNGMQFVLPEPPPTVEMRDSFCLNSSKEKIDVSPDTGSFDSPLVTKEDGTFFFNPTEVGTHKLTYTVLNRVPVFVEVRVLALPTVGFDSDKLAENEVVFVYRYTDAKILTFDFGDGLEPEKIAVNGSGEGRVNHKFLLKEDGSGEFVVTLTATNGRCETTEPVTNRVIFEPTPPEPIELKAEEFVCFSKDIKLKVTGKPAGGKFTSDTLEISTRTGSFIPNVEGLHTVLYTVGNRAEGVKFFVLPETFAIENIQTPVTNISISFEIVIMTPPDGVVYQWRIDDQPAITPLSSSQEGGNKTRFKFARLRLLGQQMNLQIFARDKPVCDIKTVAFRR